MFPKSCISPITNHPNGDILNMKFMFVLFFINLCFSATADSYHCYYPCKFDKDNECSLYYHKTSKNTFYEEKKWRVYNAQENDDHLLLTRNGFPQKDDLPEALFFAVVHIDKLNDFQFVKSCTGNSCEESYEIIKGKCMFVKN